MKPKPAQIEAARSLATRILLEENTAIVPANREHLIHRFTQEIAALTAAAEVGEQFDQSSLPTWEDVRGILPAAAEVGREKCPHCGQPTDWLGQFQCRCTGVAAAEVADYDLKCTNGHDRCYMGPSDDCPYCERVPAAAEVGRPSGLEDGAYMIGYREGIRATIERCAQVAKEACDKWQIPSHRIVAAIRALKND
jgi:transposase